MRGTVFSRLRAGISTICRDTRGNTMMLTAGALVPIVALVGSGVDIGRAYMAELRLQQACDAGVLAGRRAMQGGDYDSNAEGEANKMFAFNFPSGMYASSGVDFKSKAQGTSNVVGEAKVTLPTDIMKIFGTKQFDLAVNCTAKLEISNADIMMVLDVTGSMATTNSGDSVNRISALKTATMNFFDTLTTADVGDGRLRFGVVPYSSSANVGQILYAKNPDWLSNNVLLPSRTPIFKITYGNGQTVENGSSTGSVTYGNWSNVSNVSGQNSSSCGNLEPPADTTPSPSGSPTVNQTGQTFDSDGNRVTTNNSSQTYTYYNYRYTWSSNRCRLQRRVATYTQTSTTTTTEEPIQTFDNKYRYEDRVFDVTQAKAGSAIVTDTGDSGANYSATWGGCVMERETVAFGPTQTAPAGALDMDVDSAPTSDDGTKWKVLIPEIAFPRAKNPSSSGTTSALNVNSSSVSSDSTSGGSWQRYSKYWSSGWGVCPAPSMKLTTMTASDRSSFNTYINALQPVGGTYHDSGMVWGIRLLSPDGMFADENAEAPNKRPISRHIVFMTDGDMSANMGNLTFQGYEWTMQRVGGTSDSNLTDRHNNRFLQLCEKAKAKNITIWVVGFGTSLNTQLTTCATPGKAYEASNASQLNDNFQAIARQISKLRLSQ
ncbi:TadE/TadG family type IV pilus assembly protein [Sphingopyxis sp.]|uniref:pilus assembly protein n=1 Tax=Sphingopyxis sp. TaxID=1908224 RepID=UPI0025892C7D|nr:TadE/TadG family type IV pilus assembly protein [Sphingopyxis sp.]